MRVLTFAAALVFAGFAAADDKKSEPKGEDVAGKVTFEGQPLPSGTVTFVSKDGKASFAAPIDAEGSYSAKVPVGEYKITVGTAPAKKGDPKDPPKPVVKIPALYGDPDKTPLTVKVVAGKQVYDIVLRK